MSGWQVLAAANGPSTRLTCTDRSGATIASAELEAAIGLDVPRYWYRLGCMVLAAPELRLFHRQRTLLLGNDHTGAAELRAIDVDARLDAGERVAAIRRLVRAALLRLRITGQGAGAPEPVLIVELPGWRAHDGRSPFWGALGAHFYEGDPAAAAERLGPDWRSHVAALLPREPLLVSFLAQAAQDVLGRPVPAVQATADALRAEGLRDGRYVTIDDGGPIYESPLDVLPGWREAREVLVRQGDDVAAGEPCLLADASGARVVEARLDAVDGAASATAAALAALGASPGDRRWATPAR
jgi:arginine N-succinyltransferase